MRGESPVNVLGGDTDEQDESVSGSPRVAIHQALTNDPRIAPSYHVNPDSPVNGHHGSSLECKVCEDVRFRSWKDGDTSRSWRMGMFSTLTFLAIALVGTRFVRDEPFQDILVVASGIFSATIWWFIDRYLSRRKGKK